MNMKDGFKPLSETEHRSVNDQLIASGIAERMLNLVKKDETEETFNPRMEECHFSIMRNNINGSIFTTLVIEIPNPDPLQVAEKPRIKVGYLVRQGMGFGGNEEAPLSDEQIQLIDSL